MLLGSQEQLNTQYSKVLKYDAPATTSPTHTNAHFAIMLWDYLIVVTHGLFSAASFILADRTQQTFCTRLNKCAAQ